jgi:quinol-cytochrome oxidoreductase complex cytochrome b subunit
MVATVLRWMIVALIAAFVVLLVSGLYLTWNYRPAGAFTWAKLMHIDADRLPTTIRSFHQVASRIFVVLGLTVGVLAVVLAVQRRLIGPGFAGVAFLVAVLAASFTGVLLPWDQVGLFRITVGTDYKGYAPIISGDQIRFADVGGSRISPGTLTRWFFAHEVVVPLVLIALGAVLFRLTRRSTEEVL